MKLRSATDLQRHKLATCATMLRSALRFAVQADCPALCKKLRSARASLGGAQRHMQRRLAHDRSLNLIP